MNLTGYKGMVSKDDMYKIKRIPKRDKGYRGKGRSVKTYQHKLKKMEGIYKKNKKIQDRYTMEEWLKNVKKSTGSE